MAQKKQPVNQWGLYTLQSIYKRALYYIKAKRYLLTLYWVGIGYLSPWKVAYDVTMDRCQF